MITHWKRKNQKRKPPEGGEGRTSIVKNKIWLGITTGSVAFLRTAEELWYRTNMDLPGIVFWSLTAYFAGIVATYAVTEMFRIKIMRRKKNPATVDLREEWRHGRTKTASCKCRRSA